MDRGKTRQANIDARALDKLYRETGVLAPELDDRDDDVFGLDLKLPGFFPAATREEIEEDGGILDPDDLDDDGDLSESEGLDAPLADLESRVHRRRTEAIPADSKWTWSQRLLVGLLVANMIIVITMLLVPALFRPARPAVDVAERPSPNVRRPVASTRNPIAPVPGIETMPDYEMYESAQYWIGRGYYDKATSILRNYVSTQTRLSPHHSQAVYSSLAYCALRLGDAELAETHSARVEEFRRVAASPEDLWNEVGKARGDGRAGVMRELYARLLLKQDDLPEWLGSDRITAARIGYADSYRLESNAPARGARTIR